MARRLREFGIEAEFPRIHHFASDAFSSKPASLDQFVAYCETIGEFQRGENPQTIRRGLAVCDNLQSGRMPDPAIREAWSAFPLATRQSNSRNGPLEAGHPEHERVTVMQVGTPTRPSPVRFAFISTTVLVFGFLGLTLGRGVAETIMPEVKRFNEKGGSIETWKLDFYDRIPLVGVVGCGYAGIAAGKGFYLAWKRSETAETLDDR